MKKLLIAVAICFCNFLNAQNSKIVSIAFYNQENLFDTINNPNKQDEEYLPESKLKWNTDKYFNKLNNMSQAIMAINDGKSPDILGMCEVESIVALNDLTQKLISSTKQNLDIIHFESMDERGIDNAIIYDASKVKLNYSKAITINSQLIGGDKTRDIVYAQFKLKNKQILHVFVNHWPSRREGQKESEYKRIAAASTLKQFTDSLIKLEPNANIVIMGDFNDTPTDTSICCVLNATNDINKFNEKTYLYNTMHSLKSKGLGTHFYKGEWGTLDQIIISKNLLNHKSKVWFEPNSAKAVKENFMLETEAKYKGQPKRTFAGSKYLNGYSDHLPVTIKLLTK